MQRHEILAQRSMHCLGQVTKVFGHVFLCVDKQVLNQQALSFKMTPRTTCHPWGAANLVNPGLATRL